MTIQDREGEFSPYRAAFALLVEAAFKAKIRLMCLLSNAFSTESLERGRATRSIMKCFRGLSA